MITDNFVPNPGQVEAQRLLYSTLPYNLLPGGSGGGKSRVILEYQTNVCLYVPGSRHLALRRTRASVKESLWNQVFMDVLASKPGLKETVKLNLEELTATFRNGSVLRFGGLETGDQRDKILGQTVLTAWLNEATDFGFEDFEDVDSRIRQVCRYEIDGKTLTAPTKLILDCNPTKKSHFAYRLFVEKINPATRQPLADPGKYRVAHITPEHNVANLGAGYIQRLKDYSPERRRRFFEGQWGEDVENALFLESWVNDHRVVGLPVDAIERRARIDELRAQMDRIVVAVDPSVTKSDKSDETGIVVVGLDADGFGYVLADVSMKAHTSVWGKAVIDAYHRWQADRITVEGNQGRDLLVNLLHSIDPTANVALVNAKNSKVSRAEPVAELYRRGLIRHVGEHRLLEDQMYALESTYKKGMSGVKSPDRVDAMVWGFTELMVGRPVNRHVASGKVTGRYG